MHEFSLVSSVPWDRQDLFQYHANSGALNRLIPPWENVAIERRSDSLTVGSEVVIAQSLFGIPVRWVAKHTRLDAPESFQDIQVSGPFHSWVHDHLFEDQGSGKALLTDHVRFEMRFGWLSRIGLPLVKSKLAAMFAFRHQTTKADLRLKNFLRPFVGDRVLRIGVTGSTGLIGRRLVDLISVLGHKAVRIRRPTSSDRTREFPSSAQVVTWDTGKGFSDVETMQGLDAVIHLAGQGIASNRWTSAVKKSIRTSRVQGTRALVTDLTNLELPPKSFVCASGVGLYGDRQSDVLDESSKPGSDFLATLAQDWEQAAREFGMSGRRVAIGRLGIALHPRQGALAKLLLPFKLGLGGPIGHGRQFWSWIDVDDAAAGFLYLAANPHCEGAYNLVAPEQVDNRTFSKTLAKVLHRPSLVPTPAIALRVLLGEMADSMLMASTRASCKRLLDDHFPFRSETLEEGLRHVLGLTKP